MGEAFCGSLVRVYVDSGARRDHQVRVNRILERNLGRGTRPWPLSRGVAETGKRPMEGRYRRGLVSPVAREMEDGY